MKRYSQLNSNINEACATSDVNPGNLLSNTGVANHYTPVHKPNVVLVSYKSFLQLNHLLTSC